MPKRDAAPLGAPCWVDVMTSQPDTVRAFYCELLGWKLDDPGPDYGGYVNFAKDDVWVAGSMGAQPGEPADFWTVYLATDDARRIVDAATEHGGQVFLPPTKVMELGTMALVADPGGAAVGVWQPAAHQGFGIMAESGAPSWFELQTRDYDACIAFYRDVFGWDTHTESDEPDFRYTTLGQGEGALAGIMDGTQVLGEAPAAWSVYFGVDDADATLQTVEQLGGSVLVPAMDSPYGRLAAATDPAGAAFKIVAG